MRTADFSINFFVTTEKSSMHLTDDVWMEIACHLGVIELSRAICVSKEMARLVSDFLFSKYAFSLKTFMNTIVCKREPNRRLLLRYASPPELSDAYKRYRYRCLTCGGHLVDVACCYFCFTA